MNSVLLHLALAGAFPAHENSLRRQVLDCSTYCYCHDYRPRLQAWIEFATITGRRDWATLMRIYCHDKGGIWKDRRLWRRWLSELHHSGEALKVMAKADAAQLKQWRKAGARLLVYRAGQGINFSYTTKLATAEWFATTYGGPIRTFSIDPSAIIYFTNGRGENEVIALPESAKEVPSLQPIQAQVATNYDGKAA